MLVRNKTIQINFSEKATCKQKLTLLISSSSAQDTEYFLASAENIDSWSSLVFAYKSKISLIGNTAISKSISWILLIISFWYPGWLKSSLCKRLLCLSLLIKPALIFDLTLYHSSSLVSSSWSDTAFREAVEPCGSRSVSLVTGGRRKPFFEQNFSNSVRILSSNPWFLSNAWTCEETDFWLKKQYSLHQKTIHF